MNDLSRKIFNKKFYANEILNVPPSVIYVPELFQNGLMDIGNGIDFSNLNIDNFIKRQVKSYFRNFLRYKKGAAIVGTGSRFKTDVLISFKKVIDRVLPEQFKLIRNDRLFVKTFIFNNRLVTFDRDQIEKLKTVKVIFWDDILNPFNYTVLDCVYEILLSRFTSNKLTFISINQEIFYQSDRTKALFRLLDSYGAIINVTRENQ